MNSDNTFTLSSGIKIPVIGFGPGIMGYKTGLSKSRNNFASLFIRLHNKFIVRPQMRRSFSNSISSALKTGFRLFDYSNAYGNMNLVGEAIRKSGVDRKELFITSRISNQAQFNDYVREEFLKSLSDLNLEYVDLLQFHWPVTGKYIDTWKEMLKLKEDGYVRVLGVANCHQHHLEALENEAGVLPEVNQIEVHPLFTQKALINHCKSKGIQIEAYTPVARYDDRLIRLPLLKKLEAKYGKNFIQIILRWHIQNGVIPVVRALNPKHQKSNIDLFDFELSEEDMKLIDSINLDSRLRYNPDNCDFTIL